tara:strand:+ start:437 stop:982 length:546 start_codon:yes stop_codon:yes gene_type:complete
MSILKESKISSKIVYKGEFLDVRSDKVKLPNGAVGTREWINHPGASVIIPLLPDGTVGLIRQYRYAAKDDFIELPAGKIDAKENAEQCANRELEEEIGYKANKISFIADIHPAIGFTNELMSIYLAQDLIKTKEHRDKDEFLELVPMKLNVAIDMIWSNKITDVKTIIGLLWFQKIKNTLK